MRNAETPSVTPSSHSTDPDNTNTMKTQTTSSKSEFKNGLASRLNMASWRKHHVATMTADEVEWPQREPSGNLGRIFVLLLLLHVFIIGAVVIYNIMTPKNPGVAKTDTAPAAIDKAKSSNGTKIAAVPRSTTPPAAAVPPAGNKEIKLAEIGNYEVRSGDNAPALSPNSASPLKILSSKTTLIPRNSIPAENSNTRRSPLRRRSRWPPTRLSLSWPRSALLRRMA